MQNSVAIAAVIPAAGVGSRMDLTLPKQYLRIAGTTVLEHSVRAIAQDPRIGAVIVAIAADDLRPQQLSFKLDIPIYFVTGGASRAASVAAGVAAAQQYGFKYVAVHDAARPCLYADELAAVIDAGLTHPDGALLALPVADTLKRSCGDDVEATVSREQLWRALTPQVFASARLLQALQQVGVDNPAITDEASAIELTGGQPRLVHGRQTNLKITQPGDERLAELFLQAAQAATIA